MPSHRADTSVNTRRRNAARTVPAQVGPGLEQSVEQVVASFAAPSKVSSVLPPGVVDTRPPGMRIIDIRDSALAEGPVTSSGLSLGQVGLVQGAEVVNGVVDTRPHGVRLPDAATRARRHPVPSQAEVENLFAPVRRSVDVTPQALRVPLTPPSGLQWLPEVEAADDDVEAHLLAGPLTRGDRSAGPSPYMRRSELRKLESSRSSRRSPGSAKTLGSAKGNQGSTKSQGRKNATSSMSVPQVGIASALGLATIAAPLTGALAVPSDAQTSTKTAIVEQAAVAAPAFPQLAFGPDNAVEDTRIVTDDSVQAVVPAALSRPSRLLVTRASRSSERAVLPGCTGEVSQGAIDASANGKLPKAMLCTLWDKEHQLRADAAVALAKLNVAYNQRFGQSICLVDAYRTLSAQYAIKAQRGYFAATPGTSEHGEGLAIDLCGGAAVDNTAGWTWLRANAPRYGWDNPRWARPGGDGPEEPWHFEYLAGEGESASGD